MLAHPDHTKQLFVLLALLLLTGCHQPENRLDFIRGEQIALSDTLAQDTVLLKTIAPYKTTVDQEVNRALCHNPRLLSKREGRLESSLGNLLADFTLEAGDRLFAAQYGLKPDMALLNYGGVRIALEEGTVTIEDIYQLMPFENRLVMIELPPEKLQQLIAYLVREKRAHPFAGLRLELSGGKLLNASINGKPIDPARTYRVATSDYLANGGDHMDFFANAHRYNTKVKLRDIFIESFAGVDTLKAVLDGRFLQKQPPP